MHFVYLVPFFVGHVAETGRVMLCRRALQLEARHLLFVPQDTGVVDEDMNSTEVVNSCLYDSTAVCDGRIVHDSLATSYRITRCEHLQTFIRGLRTLMNLVNNLLGCCRVEIIDYNTRAS